jgi:hypothetical protein
VREGQRRLRAPRVLRPGTHRPHRAPTPR